MATFDLLGRTFDVAPYKLGAMRRAAPYIDRMNAAAAGLPTIEGMADAAADLCGFLSIGLVKIDSALTSEGLEDMVGLGDLPALRNAFTAILNDSGLKTGEAPAAPVAESPEASPTDSAPSSTS